jgi:alkylation response protein AidB-like acyl-CoA dehydrogenase
MDFAFTPEQQEIRKTIIDFARKELNPGIIERDRSGSFSRELWNKCAKMRLMALPFPEEYGGDGFDFITTVLVFHTLGYACKDSGLVHALATQLVSGIQIFLFGNEQQKSSLLPDLASGKKIYVQAITEPGSGSDAFAMQTTAIKNGNDFVLNGSKTLISNGPICDSAIIFAVSDSNKKSLGGISCFHIFDGNVGFSKGKPMEKMGLRTLLNGELFFTDCHIPATSLIGREGQGTIIFGEAIEWERILIPAYLLGAMERVLEDTVEYAKQRRAFGRSITDFQAVSHKIARMKINVELGRLSLFKAAHLKNSRKRAILDTSIAKYFISESIKQACLDAIQIRGGYGYMTEYEVERDLRDSIASTIYSGTSEMQLNMIARLAGL